MPDILNIDVAYVGKQATDIIMKPIFYDEEITNSVRVMPNIKFKEQLALDSKLEKILRASKGCSRSAQSDVINVTDKFIETCPIEADLEQCAKNLVQEFMEQWLRDGGLNENDLTGTKVAKYIQEKVIQALRLDVNRIAWLGDTDDADVNYSMCDGFWKRIFDGVADYSITKAQTLHNNTPTGTEVLAWLRVIYKAASNELKAASKPDKRIWVTEDIFEGLEDAYEDREANGGFLKLIQDGQDTTRLFYRGIEVIPLRNISGYIEADFANANPNRIIYGLKDNMVLGTDLVSDFNTVEIWYDRQEKMNRIDVELKLGTQIIYGDLMVVSY